MERKQYQTSPDHFLAKAAALCSKGEKCEFEIRQKLKLWEVSEQNADAVIDYLIAEKFIDNERFTRAFVRDKLKFEKWGKLKISAHLKQKRIPEKLISSVFLEIDKISYKKNLEEILKSKLKTEKEPDKMKLKQKLFRFAASRGFESDLIMQIINKIVSENWFFSNFATCMKILSKP